MSTGSPPADGPRPDLDPARWRPVAVGLWLAFVALGLVLRWRGLASQPLFGDEHHTLADVGRSAGEILHSFGTWGSHASLPLLQKLSLALIGEGVVAFRLPALVPGLLTVLLAFPVARRLVGAPAALVASAAIALSPILVYYSRFARGYALAVLLALVLVGALHVALREDGARRRAGWIVATLCGGLLPWVHLSSASVSAALFLAALVAAAVQARSASALGPPLLAGAGALALAALLYAPAWSAVLAYLERVAGGAGVAGEVGLFDVTTLLGGGVVAGAALLVLVPVGLLLRAREDGVAAFLCLAGILGPLVGFLVARPYGMAYAFTRYFLPALPLAWMLAALVVVRLALHLRPGRGVRLGVGAGAAAIVTLFLTGPLSPTSRAADGPFGNTYLALRALPAFDQPDPGAPTIYEQLAGEEGLRIIEAPPLTTRSVLLYRSHWLRHGHTTLVGLPEPPRAGMAGAPYVDLLAPDLPQRADVLILHRAPAPEAAAYWDFVYGTAWPSRARSADESYMARQRKYAPPPPPPPDLEVRLVERWGEPERVDEHVLVWRLDR